MEGQISDSLSKQQCLKTKLTNELQNVQPPEMYAFDMQCIYRVPPVIRETNPKAYTPQIVSIGPLHKARDAGKEDIIFESMEELKVKYLKAFLNRTQIPMGTFVVTLQALEDKIRSCYAVRIKYNSDDFLKMILIDGCFIIELFLRLYRYNYWRGKDPVLLKDWMRMQIKSDLILLENQLPFFVLKQLYNLAGMNQEFPSFLHISFNCLKRVGCGTWCPTESPKHFTDLMRTSIISSSKFVLRKEEECKVIKHVYSAGQLREAGLKFKVSPNENECLLDLTYSSDGVLTMPILNIADDSEVFFRNIVAFEECHLSDDTNIITQYRKILDFLINTEKDVNVLVDKKIIVNWMGDANAVATMVNSLGSNIGMPRFNPVYFSLCNSLNDFYESPCNKYKAIFKHDYFNTPWKIASTVAAIVLLLLTLIQTICSINSLF
ncbi:hypothetical protein JHK85_046224 [Glycine max]|uniref:UPF0481 protein isoform A n=1 Tax=Glycine soja TaxID=3848 RepID=A0A445GJC2_GLYSO|nr:UPF0481 protein At3g47200-like isoform X2 [Glycine soja]XP_028205565.1 UPF0481 protein At3g47200-like isoform X2 [Glycine soja]KAG4952357.1 hypothetical protein JHK85_046224 [Glycine max]RZB61324.1 UPF0481 protein isoform A [Glycine soja]RZB61325.1 UPF0481 protein isoform B [Glycine soja]